MKNLFKRLFAFVLVLALLAASGCGGVNNATSIDSTALSGSDFVQGNGSLYSSQMSSLPALSSNTNVSNWVGSDSTQTSHQSGSSLGNSSLPISSQGQAVTQTLSKEFTLQGIWLSCFEMPFMGNDKETSIAKINDIMQSVSQQGYNAIFCHVRPYADALYPSEYFPFSAYASGTQGVDPGYDPLEIMIEAAKRYNLQFHAWVNPYRVSNKSNDPTLLSENNIARSWLADGSGRAVVSGNGIYFNPASSDVKRLVLNGVKEIIRNYDVDGIHFDDYFYPTTDAAFDSKAYNEYKQSAKTPLSLADWRRANVNSLIAAVYNACKNSNVLFGISPAGDISLNKTDRNYVTLYADVPLWLSTKGYVDYIIPQIYFGYNYPKEAARYLNLLNIWSKLPRHSGVKLYVGLGAYKMDEPCDDSAEWHNDTTLLARQVTDAYNNYFSGAVVFSYSAAFAEKQHNKTQMNNMLTAIKNIRSK